MAADDFDRPDDDERATRTTRRASGQTERLPAETGSSYGEPVRERWRSERVTSATRARRTQALPSSRQELVIWLQRGGWRIVAAVSAVVILLLFLIVFLRSPRQSQTVVSPTTTNPFTTSIQQQQAAPSPRPAPTTAPQPAVGAQFRVSGTDIEGLFLRPDHSTEGAPLKTLPEGTIVTVVGDDFSGPDRVWKRVRDPDGTEGWAAVDFLQPVQ